MQTYQNHLLQILLCPHFCDVRTLSIYLKKTWPRFYQIDSGIKYDPVFLSLCFQALSKLVECKENKYAFVQEKLSVFVNLVIQIDIAMKNLITFCMYEFFF